MATTTNGIYYPDDYEKEADVPADMKAMAESMEKNIIPDITNIKTEQKTQNTNISNLQADNNTNKTDITNIKAEQTSQNTELEELRAENERLRADIKGLAIESEPLSGETIDLTDSAEMRFSEFEIRGNSKQEIRSGKNKVKLNNIQETTKDGLKYSCRNGKLYLNGTLTKAVLIDFEATDIQAGNYYFSSYVEGNHSGSWARYLRTVNSEKAITNSGTIEITENEKVYFRFYANEGCVFNNAIVTAQLEEGSSATEWEQYGACPSPDHPSEVEYCGDNVNLFDGELESGNINSTGVNYVDSTMIRSKNYTKVKPNTDIVIANDETIIQSNVIEYDENYNFIAKTYVNAIKFTTNSQTNYIKFVCSLVTENKIKIEYNSKPTPHSPYGQGCINEVVCNNSFDGELEQGTISSSNGNTSNATTRIRTKNFIEIDSALEYTITALRNNDVVMNIYEYNENKGYIAQTSSSWLTMPYLFKSKTNTKYIKIVIKHKDDTDIYITENIKLKVYDKSQTYTIPTQQPIRSVGDTRDTFVKKNNKWYERHYIGRYELTGNESITANTVYANTFNIILSDVTMLGDYISYCNIAEGVVYNPQLLNEKDNIIMATGGVNTQNRFIHKSTSFAELSEYQAYLQEQYNAGTPFYIDYVLSTPKDIGSTAEQTAILDKIYNEAKSYKGVTHIYSTDDVEPNVKVTYKKDLDTMINNLNTAIVAMGGV